MKRAFLVMMGSGLAATWLGCQPAAEPTGPASTTTTSGRSDSAALEVTLVSLDVPNML